MNKKTILMAAIIMLLSVSAFAQATPYEPLSGATQTGVRWGLVSAAFLLGIAAACEGIARNPSAAGAIRLGMIIGLALIESLVIYALIIAYLLMGK